MLEEVDASLATRANRLKDKFDIDDGPADLDNKANNQVMTKTFSANLGGDATTSTNPLAATLGVGAAGSTLGGVTMT